MRPRTTPWGKIQHCRKIIDGIYQVSTEGHGGIMVAVETSKLRLSDAAVECGFIKNGFICYEEDCDAQIVLRELLDSNLWQVPDSFTGGREAYENIINASLVRWHPEYWCERQKRYVAPL